MFIACFSIAAKIYSQVGITANNEISGAQNAYQCPMKCEGEKTYYKPGKCPVCKMNLQLIKKTEQELKNNISPVKITGAMRNVMMKGELAGTINLDTIQDKAHLYGLGPVEYLKGEILIYDGISYVSSVTSKGSVKVDESFKVKAPFFVYENISKWREVELPDSVQSIPQLDAFIEQKSKNWAKPVAFRLLTEVESAKFHIVNLPPGTEVHSPDDAHKGEKTFTLENEKAELFGFFSTEHQGVFTHHDSNVHIHYISPDRKKMGHLDMITMKKGKAKLFIGE